MTLPPFKINWNSDFVQKLLDSYEASFTCQPPHIAKRRLNHIVYTLKTAYPEISVSSKDVLYHVHLRNRGVNGPKKILLSGDPYHMFRRPAKKHLSCLPSICAPQSAALLPTSSRPNFSTKVTSIFKSSTAIDNTYDEKRLGTSLDSTDYPEMEFRQVKHIVAYDVNLQLSLPCFDSDADNKLVVNQPSSMNTYQCQSCHNRFDKLSISEHQNICIGKNKKDFYVVKKKHFVNRILADVTDHPPSQLL